MRDRAPIFVVGSARSGTTLLYRLLLSSGHFPPYRTEPVVFEDLVLEPQQTLAQMSEFIGLPLDYKRIQSSPLGVVSAPNTSFPAELRSGSFEPVGRWKKQLSTDDVRQLESLIGDTLEELEYPLSCPARPKTSLRLSSLKATYPPFYSSKEWSCLRTPLGHFVNMNRLVQQES